MIIELKEAIMPDLKRDSTEPEVIKNGICYMCTNRCPTRIHVSNGRATQIDMVDPDVAEHCPRGKAQLDFVYHPDRLQTPLKRTGKRHEGAFVPISWDEALDTVATDLLKVKKEFGPESVVFWIAYTKEPRLYFHRLAHAFGSPNYCTESSNCFSSQWLATVLTYGRDYSGAFVMQGMATRCKLIWSSSVEQSMPPIWHHLAAKQRGLKLIVVDPRRTTLASMADIHLQLRPGTDGALALGMINVIINEKLYDKEFVEKWTVGFDDLKKLAQEYPPKKVAEITWVPAAKIKEAAMLYAREKPARIEVSANATTHHYNGVENHRAIILLSALTGNFDVPGGNCWMPDPIPTNDITLHERVANMSPGLGSDRFPIWTSMYREMQSNVLADRIESGKPYPIKAIFGAGLHPEYFPNSNRLAENLKKLDFIVVTDYFHTAGTRLADIVLPIASWLERHILITGPGSATLIEPAIEPVGQTWPEWKIYFELAKRLGLGDEFWGGDLEACFNYRLQPSGITVDDLVRQPEGTVKRPLPAQPAKYYEQAGFQTPSGKVEISSSILAQHGHEPLPVYKEPAESPFSQPQLADSYPLVLTSGARNLAYTHSQFRNIPALRELMPEPLVDINPADANARGIESGDMVMIVSPRGCIMMKANVTDTILPGVVSLPHHWPGEANVNSLIDDKNLDPISGFAPSKSSLCQVGKA
jgi:anaerobic selenocysteine-containing dehydrogenase